LDLSLFLNVLSRKNIKKNLAIGLLAKTLKEKMRKECGIQNRYNSNPKD
jgi:hypothetical protein